MKHNTGMKVVCTPSIELFNKSLYGPLTVTALAVVDITTVTEPLSAHLVMMSLHGHKENKAFILLH